MKGAASQMWQSILEVLKQIPPREAMLWVALAGVLFLFFKLSLRVIDRLQKENKALTDEKRWLWEQLKVQIPNSGLNHYPEKGKRKPSKGEGKS